MKRTVVDGVVFVLAAALTAHLLYGGLGFCPTDEGYLLSGSRRLLDGRIPHRDYVSLRPVGTHLLHAHLLLWAGDRLIWWSRLLTWMQVATTTWLWIVIAEKLGVKFGTRAARAMIAAFGFLASTNSFPIMPWNTYDGVFFISLGIAVTLARPSLATAGAFLIGLSTIFRQNFVFPVPLLIMALGHYRRIAPWILAVLPGTLYLAVMFAAGGLGAMFAQMGTAQGSLAPVLLAFTGFSVPFLQGAVCGLLGGAASLASHHKLRLAGRLLLSSGLLYAAFILPFADGDASIGWFLFAATLGVLPFRIRNMPPCARLSVLALITGWGAAISVGHAQPTLISGALVVAFSAFLLETSERDAAVAPRLFQFTLVVTLALALYAFHRGRIMRINCDLPASYLTHEIGDAFPGGRGIRTNPNTYALLADLTTVTRAIRASGRTYGVVPECTQFWVLDPVRNPLSSDWPIDGELGGKGMMNRVLDEVDSLGDSGVFLVQKYWLVYLPFERRPIRPGESRIVDRIRETRGKIGETEFFEIYR